MEHHRNLGREFALCFCLLVAGAVVFFWLRELDLTFLATYRIPIGILIAVSGITLGILAGLSVGQRTSVLAGLSVIAIPRSIAIFLLLLGAIAGTVIFLKEIRDQLLDYWRTAQHLPANTTEVTGILLSLLLAASVSGYAFTFGLLIIREVWIQRRAARTST